MNSILSDDFLKQYTDQKSPLSPIGEFVYLRTYARYLEDRKRREKWYETVLRTTEYNIGLGIKFKEKNGLKVNMEEERKEAEALYDHLFHLRTFTSGRTLYMGGTEVVEQYPLSNYNCAFTVIENMHDLVDVFYLLMVGSGVGIRIDNNLVTGLPTVRHIELEGKYDVEVRQTTRKEDMEHTYSVNDTMDNSVVTIRVGDSKEGWCDALEKYFQLITLEKHQEIKKIIIDYSFVRPEGDRLRRFGGRASGHSSIKRMFEKMNKVFNRREDGVLKSIDILDIATIISENVVSGGVRRSAMMIICDEDDEELINAKSNLFKIVDGKWIEDEEISHRKMSNNSILYTKRPSLNRIREIINSIKINGEPGFINGIEANRRKQSFQGCNPCGEILLQSKQCCNLTTNNLLSFVKEDHSFDVDLLENVLKLSVRVAIRMTLVEVELPQWNEVMQKDRIVGISLTGMMDMVNKSNMREEDLANLLKHLRKIVHAEGIRYSNELGIKSPELMTTIKPEGSLSTLPSVSSGIHYAHSNYYVRRIRIASTDPLYKMIAEQDSYPIYNEYGESEKSNIKVIEFPVKAPEGKTKYDVGAIKQLELYKMSMINWTDHNTSITIHVKDNEWEDVAQWVYDNFEYVVGITFLPLYEETYPLLPFEKTTEEDYIERMKKVKPYDYDLLKKYDNNEEYEFIDQECSTGACPIR